MKRQVPVMKNQDYIIEIVGFGYEGEGVGKIENFPIFVQGALKGEKVKVKVVKMNKNIAFGKLIEIIESSKDRVEPICKFYKNCGGCTIQHLSYQGQLEFKKDRVHDCIERIGGFDIKKEKIEFFDTMGVDTPYRYRNKVQLPTRNEDGAKIGFYTVRSHDIVDIDQCHIQFQEADKVILVVREYINKYKIETYDEKTHSGNLRHIMVRKAFKTGEIMVVIVTKENKLKDSDKLFSNLKKEVPNLTSFMQNINKEKTNVVLGQENKLLYGKEIISDYIGEFKFNISPLSFFQVNPYQTENLYKKVLEYAELTGGENVIDAYCGTGTISLFLSKKAKKVYGVELIPSAIENAKINAKENKVVNAEFFVGKCEEIIPELIEKGVKPDVVVVDPPRKGCDKALLDTIIKVKPEKIVYVSCDPSTLARDLRILCDNGFKLKKVQPVDMFPMSNHIETIVSVRRC